MIRFDHAGNIWGTDGQNNKEGTNGQLVYKFSSDHKILMTIGTKVSLSKEITYSTAQPTWRLAETATSSLQTAM
jgi:hypothetical protein